MVDLPPAVTAKLVQIGTDTLFGFAQSWLSTVTVKKADSHQDSTKPCHTCMIHQHVVLARGYIEGTYSRLNPDGSVPAGLGGSIVMAREHLVDAMVEIPEVIGAHPAIDSACKRLTELLPEILARSENIGTDQEWQLILTQLRQAESVAYTIPETVYRREPVKDKESDDIIVVLSRADKEMLDLITQRREGKITEEQLKAQLSKLFEKIS